MDQEVVESGGGSLRCTTACDIPCRHIAMHLDSVAGAKVNRRDAVLGSEMASPRACIGVAGPAALWLFAVAGPAGAASGLAQARRRGADAVVGFRARLASDRDSSSSPNAVRRARATTWRRRGRRRARIAAARRRGVARRASGGEGVEHVAEALGDRPPHRRGLPRRLGAEGGHQAAAAPGRRGARPRGTGSTIGAEGVVRVRPRRGRASPRACRRRRAGRPAPSAPPSRRNGCRSRRGSVPPPRIRSATPMPSKPRSRKTRAASATMRSRFAAACSWCFSRHASAPANTALTR